MLIPFYYNCTLLSAYHYQCIDVYYVRLNKCTLYTPYISYKDSLVPAVVLQHVSVAASIDILS